MKYKKQISDLIKLIEEKSLLLNPRIDHSALTAVAESCGIIFPEQYAIFLTTIGNGGMLPKHSDSQGILLPLEQCNLKNISKPFPYKNTHMWSEDNSKSLAQSQCLSENGHFTFMECADGFTWELIVTGPCRGECWLFGADGMMRGPGLDFLQWVQLYITDTLSQWMIAVNQPKDNFTDYHVRIEKKIKRHKIRMNPPISIEEINKIEQINNITLPKDYVQFITTIGDGGELPISFNGKKLFCRIRSIRECDFSKTEEPFPLTNAWWFGWDWKTKKVRYDIETDPEGKWREAQNGQFCFMNLKNPNGENFSYSLIVNGYQYGKVWVCLDSSILNSGCRNFQHWFEMFINERCV